MTLNCKPGDLAISVNTALPDNEGVIVRVVRRHVNTSAWDFGDTPTWWCESDEEMTWDFPKLRILIRGHEGPVPDRYLKPIRGDQPESEDSLTQPQPSTTAPALG